LQQIVWNLLSNAIKFSPDQGRVSVYVEWFDSYVQIQVKDTGKGIPAQVMPYIFEGFRQVESSTTRSHGGLGLGLAIVRHLVELHGGTVCCESPGLGMGSTFTVQLPLFVGSKESGVGSCVPTPHSQAGTGQEPLLPTPQSPLQGLRVLVVDDEPDCSTELG
jgi:signal transduction histidine kinase